MKRYLPFLIIAAVLVIALGAIFILPRLSKSNGPSLTSNSNPSKTETTANAPHVRGPMNAVVTLEEYGDFQCPPCGRMYPEVKKIEQDYGDQLKVVFHNFPLPTVHRHALAAARAAEAAGFQGKFWEMHDRLYENQTSWSNLDDPKPIFNGYARELGLDTERFQRDMDGPEADARVQSDIQAGNQNGVNATPTFFVNGRQLRNELNVDPNAVRSAINVMMNVNR